MPHPTTGEPIGQDAKDRLGAAERDRLQAQADRFYRQQTRHTWLGDEALEDLDLAALRAEAAVRRVELPAKPTKAATLAALRAAAADLDRPQEQ
jgi:hypothetical protein